ncbi:MAG: HK97 gp10 family phage protein [Pseudomonadota bacterium]
MGWDRNPRSILEEIYEDDFGGAFRDISLQGLRGVVLKTPVDTGRARGAWLVSIGETSAASVARADKTGQATITAGGATISGAELGDVIVLENNVDYAVLLEQGPLKFGSFKSGAQAPARMVDRTLQELAANFA